MADFPLPSRVPGYAEVFNEAQAVADEYALPRDLVLGLCFAESGEGLQSFDRWHRWTGEALGHIERRDKAGLQTILDRCAAIPTNDISFGPCHQTWRWSPEYQMAGGQPYDLDAILRFRALYVESPGHAIRTAAAQIRRFWITHDPDKTETLSRYNKPDGSATASVRKRYADMLALAREKLGAQPMPPTVVYESMPTPHVAGRFATTPKGIVLHGSRSGAAGNSQLQEYRGTANWCVNNPGGLGWHVTVMDNRVAEHLDVREWAWHAKAASRFYLGCEFAQPTVNHAITDAQVDALADWITTRVTPIWGNLGYHFPSHAEVQQSGETGDSGNSDVFPLGDPRLDTLRNRLYALLGAPPGPAPTPDPPLPPLPPKPTLEEVRAELVKLTAISDDQASGRYLRAELAALVERIR